jgi:hypothetical protein
MDKKFKIGVSDWCLTFENGEVVFIKTLTHEIVSISADGHSNIRLSNACFDTKFIDLFMKNAKLNEVKQEFYLFDSCSDRSENMIEYNYHSMKIKNISMIGSFDSTTTVTFSMVC